MGAVALPVRQRFVEAHQPHAAWLAHVRQSVKRRHGSVTGEQSPVCHAQLVPLQVPSAEPVPAPRMQREVPRHQPQFDIDAQALQRSAAAQVSHAPQSPGHEAQLSVAEQTRSPQRAVGTSGGAITSIGAMTSVVVTTSGAGTSAGVTRSKAGASVDTASAAGASLLAASRGGVSSVGASTASGCAVTSTGAFASRGALSSPGTSSATIGRSSHDASTPEHAARRGTMIATESRVGRTCRADASARESTLR